MKKNITKTLALIATLCGLNAFAATPVAVWDGDFTTATKNGWTLSSTGSTITDASITIGTTPITIKHAADVNTGWYTVVYKVKGLVSTSTTPLATIGRNTTDSGYDNANVLGALAENDTPWGIWNAAKRTNTPATQQAMNLGTDATVEHRIVVRYHSGVNYGVWAFVDGTKCFVADSGLKASISKVNRFTILGYFSKSNDVLTGATVTGVAIFSDTSDAGDAAYTGYQFPSETFGDNGTFETVAFWHNDFANGSTKGGYKMTLGTGTTVNADGTVTLTAQAKGGKATKGVEINFYDDSGATAYGGKDMTVFVKYSNMTFTTSRAPFFAAIWGDSKDAGEFVISSKSKNNMYYASGITSSTASVSDTQFGTVGQEVPANGLMIVTMAGGGTANGTRVAFAARNDDGTYGDFVDYGYKSDATFSGKDFFGIKIGGTVGPIGHFYRPGMTVEGVAIIKGFTTTMRTFRYLFPDEEFHVADYSGSNPTSETKFAADLKVKTITNGVFSAKVTSGSITWVGGMVCACQKAFTLLDDEVTKVALQYQVRESDYDKSADIYFTNRTDGVYFKKTGGHYNGISGDKLGTDDATWAKSSSNYSFNNFSIYVPATKTATVSGTKKWSELDWGGEAPTADDLVVLRVTANATLTIDTAVSVAGLKVASASGKALTVKFTDATKGIQGVFDPVLAKGGITFDLSDMPAMDLARYAVIGAPYSFWLVNGTVNGGIAPKVTLPTAPTGYTFATEYWANGVRVVVTAPDTTKYGSININISNGTDIGSGNHGAHPVAKAKWNNITASALSVTDSETGATATLSGKTDTFYGYSGTQDKIQQDYVDDGSGQSITLTVTDIPYAKYRVITYLNADSDGQPYVPVVVNGTPYAGAFTGGTASYTVKGLNDNWGKDSSRGTMAEGANYVVSDVLTDSTATITITSARGTARGAPAAYQIVKVDPVAKIGDNAYDTLAAAENAVTSGQTITLLHSTGEALTTAKTFTLDFNGCVYSGNLAVSNGGAVSFASVKSSSVTGSIEIAEGGLVNVTTTLGRTMHQSLVTRTTGDGTLQFNAGTDTTELRTYEDKSPDTINVNLNYLGTGTLRYVGEGKSYDVITISADKTMTIENGTIWATRSEFVVNGGMVAKEIWIGHQSKGTYPGKVTINATGTVKTGSVTFRNYGSSQNSVLTVGGVLEFTQNDTSAILLNPSSATYAVNLSGGTIKADASSWFTDAAIPMTFVADTTTTLSAAQGKTIDIRGVLSGTGGIAVSGAGIVQLSNTTTRPATPTLDGASTGTLAFVITDDEKTSLEGGNSLDLINVSGTEFAGKIRVFETSGREYATEFTVSEGKIVVTKKEDSRTQPFNLTTAYTGNWTAAAWKDSSATPKDVVLADWDLKVDATMTLPTETATSLTADRDITIAHLTLANAGTLAILTNGTQAITADTINDSASTGATTIGFETLAPITAGANTILNTPATAKNVFTIAAEKKLTVKSGTVSEANVSNAGTLNFLGGDDDDPIVYDAHAGSGTDTGNLTIAADSYLKMLVHNQNKVFRVSGAGAATSTLEMYGNGSAQRMNANTQFRDLTLTVQNTFTGSNYFWIEQEGAVDETVVLYARGRTKINNYDFTVGGLRGGGTFAVQQDARVLTITPSANYDYSGSSSAKFTIAASSHTQSFSGSYTGALTVDEGAKAKLTGSKPQPGSMAVAGTLTIDPDGAAKTISGAITGAGNIIVNDSSENATGSVVFTGDRSGFTGTITYARGTYDVGTSRTAPTEFVFQSGLKVTATETRAEYGHGSAVTFTGFAEGQTITFRKADGTSQAMTVGAGGTATFAEAVRIDKQATLFDCTFTNLNDVGKTTGTFSYKAISGAALKYDTAATFANTNATAQIKDRGVYIRHHPYIDGAASTFHSLGDFTAVFVGAMSPTENRIFVHFGSSTSSNKGILITTMEGTDQVGVFSNKGSALTELTTLSVPNSATARHVYIVTKRTTDEGNTMFTIYLDGVKRAEKTLEGTFSLGASNSCGVQVGADFGGQIRTGTYKAVADVDTETGVLNVCRIYDYLLSDGQVSAIRAEYPYVSAGGLFERAIAGEVDYLSTKSWTKYGEGTPNFDVPTGTNSLLPSATISASSVSTITVNTNSVIDTFTFDGSAMTFVKDETGTNTITIGTAELYAAVTNEYGALDLRNTAISLRTGGALTFDLEDFPLNQCFFTTKIQMTGLTDRNDDLIKAINIPSSEGRTVTFGFDENAYYLNITVDTSIHPFVYTINEGQETGVWTWGADTTDEATVLALQTATIKKAGTGTQQFVGKNKYTYVVDGGTLKFTNTVTDVTSTITINTGATFDMNGLIDSLYNVVLNGGTLANYGAGISFYKKQLSSIALADDSYITAASNFCFVSNGYATNTLDLAGHTLTKNGEDIFILMNTVVTNGTVVVEAGQLRINAPDSTVNHTVFTNATLTIKKDAELYVGRSSLTIDAITGEGGTIHVTSGYTLSPFTLNGTLNLEGSGTYGTITMAENAVADIGTRHNLTFAGKGSVKAKLTGDYEPGDKVTLFTAASGATTGLAELKDTDGNVIDDSYYTFANGVVTFKKEAKVGTTIYFTLKQAIEDTSATAVELIADVTGGEEITVSRAISFDGGTNILSNVTFSFSGSGALTLNTGCIGIDYAEGMTLAGSCCRFTETSKTSWDIEGVRPSGYSIATLSGAVRTGYIYEFVPTQFVPDPTKEVLIPVADAKGNDAGAIKLNTEFVNKVTTPGATAQEQAKELNTQENNGLMKWQNAVLGLENKEGNIPVVATPQQTAPVGYIDFKMGGCNVDKDSGATVKYKVLTAATPGAKVWSQTGGISNYTETVRVELPASGVKYYKLEVIPETSESVKEEPKAPQVTINGKGYPSLAAAIGDAAAGDTLVVLGDLETGADVNVAKDMTIDMNELTIAGTLNVKSGATLTVCGVGEFDGPINVEDGGKLDFKNGKHVEEV